MVGPHRAEVGHTFLIDPLNLAMPDERHGHTVTLAEKQTDKLTVGGDFLDFTHSFHVETEHQILTTSPTGTSAVVVQQTMSG